MNPFLQGRSGCDTQPARRGTYIRCAILVLLVVVLMNASLTPVMVAAPPPLNPEEFVRQWGTASQVIPPLGRSAQKRAFQTYCAKHNAHQIALINEFRGPVDADDLLQRYRFTEATRTDQVVRLTAIPRDEVERLFVRQWELTLDAENHLPAFLTFFESNANNRQNALVLFDRRERERMIRTKQTDGGTSSQVVQVAAVESNPSTVHTDIVRLQSPDRRMPSLVGLPWQKARAQLQQAGFDVRLNVGPPAAEFHETNVIQSQFPVAGADLTPDTTVILTLYGPAAK